MGRMQSNTIDIHITLTQNMTNNSISSNSPDLTPQSITCAKVTNPINARSCGDTYPTKVCPPHSLINREITKYMIPRLNSTSTKTHSYGRYQNTIYEDDHASIIGGGFDNFPTITSPSRFKDITSLIHPLNRTIDTI